MSCRLLRPPKPPSLLMSQPSMAATTRQLARQTSRSGGTVPRGEAACLCIGRFERGVKILCCVYSTYSGGGA